MSLRHLALMAVALFISSCDLILAPLFAPSVPPATPNVRVQAVIGWVYSDGRLKLLAEPDYSAVEPGIGIKVAGLAMGHREGVLTIVGVWAQGTEPERGRPQEVISDWYPLPSGVYQVESMNWEDEARPIATIDTAQGRGGSVFDASRPVR